MANDFNYGAAELGKLNPESDRYGVKLRAEQPDNRPGPGETRWVLLSPEQYAQVADLIISFNLG